jgi:hypothetical protein
MSDLDVIISELRKLMEDMDDEQRLEVVDRIEE